MADLDEILTTAFVLNMDSKLLCRPDCKGICPRCGKNLNEGACSCRPEIDPRLAVNQGGVPNGSTQEKSIPREKR